MERHNKLIELPQQNRERRYVDNNSTKKRKYGPPRKSERIHCTLCWKASKRGSKHFRMLERQKELQNRVRYYNQGMFDV